jgi:hypothetical protein
LVSPFMNNAFASGEGVEISSPLNEITIPVPP